MSKFDRSNLFIEQKECMLSEIAKERPELLVLVISVRNGGSDAYQQVHRVNPVAIDFMAGGNPELVQQDRRCMLLHRLLSADYMRGCPCEPCAK